MSTDAGIYKVEDALYLNQHGWILVGRLIGVANSGNDLTFPSGLSVRIKSLQLIREIEPSGRIFLLISAPFTRRQRPIDRQILDEQMLGTTARILE